jgi:hypothetical protein
LNTLEARLCRGRHSKETESLRSSVRLCQEGIEHKHRVLRKNSAMSSTEVRITEDSRHSSRRELSRCIYELCGFRWRRARRAYQLNSLTQGKTSRLLNTLEGTLSGIKHKEKREAPRSSVNLYQVGIE